MEDSASALYSRYIIDGIQMDYTPAQMLMECMPEAGRKECPPAGTIVDETVDPLPGHTSFDSGKISQYLAGIAGKPAGNSGTIYFPRSYTRRRIASALLSAIWRKGHFTLEDLAVKAGWEWNTGHIGSMASFYFSAEAAAQYLFDLGVKIKEFGFSESRGVSKADFEIHTAGAERNICEDDEYDFLRDIPARNIANCWISDERKVGDTLVDDEDSWLIYIPFDTCPYRLGDSALEAVAGISGETAPEIQDPDYFIDCFEVIRELAEDGVVVAGRTIGEGGLAAAAEAMCGTVGIRINISGIEASYMENDIVRILFAETPGVLIQIRDADYDYIDSQLILQDIAYYPLGHPGRALKGLSVTSGKKSGISDILAALIQGQYSEGED